MSQIKHVIPVNPEDTLINELMKLQYDMDARKELLGYLISANNNHTEAFKDYEQEYIALYTKYIQLKDKLEKTIIQPYCEEHNMSIYTWNLDFNDNIITIQ